LDILENARSELEEEKPPPFEMDLESQILTEDNFTPKSEEQRLETISIIREIIMYQSKKNFKLFPSEKLRKIMTIWRKVNNLDEGKLLNSTDADLMEYTQEVLEQIRDEIENESAYEDKDEMLRSITENIQNSESIQENQFDDITKTQLETFVYHKRIEHKDPVDKSTLVLLTKEKLIQQTIHILEMENCKPTMSATKYFLGNKEMTANLEGIPPLEIKSHLKNWYDFIGSTNKCNDLNDEFLVTEIGVAIEQWSLHPEKEEFDEMVRQMSDEVDAEEREQLQGDLSRLPKLEAKMTNKEINNLSEIGAQMVYKKYLLDKGFDEEVGEMENKSFEWL